MLVKDEIRVIADGFAEAARLLANSVNSDPRDAKAFIEGSQVALTAAMKLALLVEHYKEFYAAKMQERAATEAQSDDSDFN